MPLTLRVVAPLMPLFGLSLILTGILTVKRRSVVGLKVTWTVTLFPEASVPSAGSQVKKPQSLAASSGREAFHSAGISWLGLG